MLVSIAGLPEGDPCFYLKEASASSGASWRCWTRCWIWERSGWQSGRWDTWWWRFTFISDYFTNSVFEMLEWFLICVIFADDKRYSPEPILQQTDNHLEEEDGSFSPQLMHGNEGEDAIDPEEDKAELVESCVSCCVSISYSIICCSAVRWVD